MAKVIKNYNCPTHLVASTMKCEKSSKDTVDFERGLNFFVWDGWHKDIMDVFVEKRLRP